MARKKKQEESSAGSPWLNTFADLMNLLLCFFVLLFSFSSVDAEKYEQVAKSMSGGFSIFSGGGSAFEDGNLISSGIAQLNNLNEYNSNMGEENNPESDSEEVDGTDYMDAYIADKKKATEQLYGELSELAEKNNIGDALDITIDANYQYVKFSLNGSILFDSGKSEIKKEAIPIFSKVGDILRAYKKYRIEIEGHTDNVPINSSQYPNNNWLSSARAINAAMYLINEKGFDPKTLSWTGRGEYDPVASNSSEDGRNKNRRVEIKIYSDINNN